MKTYECNLSVYRCPGRTLLDFVTSSESTSALVAEVSFNSFVHLLKSVYLKLHLVTPKLLACISPLFIDLVIYIQQTLWNMVCVLSIYSAFQAWLASLDITRNFEILLQSCSLQHGWLIKIIYPISPSEVRNYYLDSIGEELRYKHTFCSASYRRSLQASDTESLLCESVLTPCFNYYYSHKYIVFFRILLSCWPVYL